MTSVAAVFVENLLDGEVGLPGRKALAQLSEFGKPGLAVWRRTGLHDGREPSVVSRK